MDADKKPVKDLYLTLKVFAGKTFKKYFAASNFKGVASFKDVSKLAIATHKVEITSKTV